MSEIDKAKNFLDHCSKEVTKNDLQYLLNNGSLKRSHG